MSTSDESRTAIRATLTATGIPTSFAHSFDVTTSTVPSSLLTWFDVIGYTVLLGTDIIAGRNWITSSNYSEVILHNRLVSALQRINPSVLPEAIAQALSGNVSAILVLWLGDNLSLTLPNSDVAQFL